MEFKYKTVALDFGTSYSTLAYFDEAGNVTVAKDENNREYIPSLFSCVDRMRIGYEAEQYQRRDPANTVSYIKRIIGREFNDLKLQSVIENSAFQIVSGVNGKAECRISWQGEKRQVTPEAVVSYIVDYMCSFVTSNPLYHIEHVILTVPAHFNNVQRNCLRSAVFSETRSNVTLLEEPVAAAISFAKDNDLNNKRVMVYDLGGGTFDVSVMDVQDNNYNVVFTSGESFLGGVDVTNAVYRYLVNWLKEEHELDITSNSGVNQRIYNLAESIKRFFSENTFFEETIDISPFDILDMETGEEIQEVDLQMVITEYNDIIKPVIMKTMDILDNVMRVPLVMEKPIDMIALIGGSTNIALVKELLEERYPTAKILRTDDPRSAVAKGALVYGEQQNILQKMGVPRDFNDKGIVVLRRDETLHIGQNSVILESIDDEEDVVLQLSNKVDNRKKDVDLNSIINLDDLMNSENETIVKPAPTNVEPAPTNVEPAPTNVGPAPTNVEPAPTNVKPGDPDAGDVDETLSELIINENTLFTCYELDTNRVICKREDDKIFLLDERTNELFEVVNDCEVSYSFQSITVLINGKFCHIHVDETINFFINQKKVSIKSKDISIRQVIQDNPVPEEFITTLRGPLTDSMLLIGLVTSLDIGIDLKDGIMGVLIPRGTKTTEATFVKRYNANRNYPTEIRTKIYQGNHLYSKDNIPVGTISIRNLRRRPDTNRGCIDIRVSFDENNLLKTEMKQFDEDEYRVIPIKNKLIWDENMIRRNQEEAEATRHYDELFREYYSMKALVEDLIRHYKMQEDVDEELVSKWADFMLFYKPKSSKDLNPVFMEKWRDFKEEVQNKVGAIFELF